MLENIDTWIQQALEVEAVALPGNKSKLLHLAHNMMQARGAIERLLSDELRADEPPRGADTKP